MTRSNRIANRVILALAGLLALSAAAILAAPFAAGIGIELPGVDGALILPDASQPALLWAVAAVALVVVLFAVGWILTRGRGRTGTALVVEGATIDASAVEAVLRDALANAPDVVAVSASAHERRGGSVVLVRVQARPAPDLGTLRSAVRAAIDRLDGVVGARIPLVVHLTGGVRSTFAPARATH